MSEIFCCFDIFFIFSNYFLLAYLSLLFFLTLFTLEYNKFFTHFLFSPWWITLGVSLHPPANLSLLSNLYYLYYPLPTRTYRIYPCTYWKTAPLPHFLLSNLCYYLYHPLFINTYWIYPCIYWRTAPLSHFLFRRMEAPRDQRRLPPSPGTSLEVAPSSAGRRRKPSNKWGTRSQTSAAYLNPLRRTMECSSSEECRCGGLPLGRGFKGQHAPREATSGRWNGLVWQGNELEIFLGRM